MPLFHEIPPSAGLPVYAGDFIAPSTPGSLEEDLKNFLDIPHLRITHSGTASLYLILETLKDFSPKRTVVMPAFVCPSIVMAALRAGLRLEFCDVQAERFDYEYDKLDKLCSEHGDILAVVAVHLAGIPADVRAVQKIVQNRGIFLVEDCAQALGAQIEGKKVGAFGDFAFFSLKRGKGLTIYEGGFFATHREDYAKAADEKYNKLTKANALTETLNILGLLGYGVFYQPSLFWFVFKLRENYWNRAGDAVRAMGENFTTDFGIDRVSEFRKSVGHACFNRWKAELENQRRKAYFLINQLEGRGPFRLIKELPGSRASYPYVTLLLRSAAERVKILKAMDTRGLGASVIYVHAITDYEYLKKYLPEASFPNARRFAECVVTLSTSAFISDAELREAVRCIIGDKEGGTYE